MGGERERPELGGSAYLRACLVGSGVESPKTLVSIQSVSLGVLTRTYLPGIRNFEDRNLYLLEFLRAPDNHLLYVVSNDLDSELLEYHISAAARCMGLNPSDIKRRLDVVRISIGDNRSLAECLVDDPEAYRRLLDRIGSLPLPILDFWVAGPMEQKLAQRMGLPYIGSLAGSRDVDSKSAARRIFAEVGIPHAGGIEDLTSLPDVRSALSELSMRTPTRSFLLKLNDEEAGNGIAEISADALDLPASDFSTAIVPKAGIPFDRFHEQIERSGCVLEECLAFDEIASPSVKMCIDGTGNVENLASHDQVLVSRAYAGSMFPADDDYRKQLVSYGHMLGERLAQEGVRGVFSVDFFAGRSARADSWKISALEINVRKGATSHPYFWTRFLTGAKYDADRGVMFDTYGPVAYASSEFVHHESLKRISLQEILDVLKQSRLGFSDDSKRGIYVHMASSRQQSGKIGITSIAETSSAAMENIVKTRQTLNSLMEG